VPDRALQEPPRRGPEKSGEALRTQHITEYSKCGYDEAASEKANEVFHTVFGSRKLDAGMNLL